MSLIPWAARKQLTVIFFIVIIVATSGFFVWNKITAPTCFDNKQNGEEQGVDCGGQCEKQCLGEIKDIITLWSRSVRVGDDIYDSMALVNNPNLSLGIKRLKYQFKIYDSKNILIAIEPGETFINPGEEFVIFNPHVDVGHRTPARTFIEFDPNIKWEIVEKEKDILGVSKKEFINEDVSRLKVDISNKDAFVVDNIYATAILYDENENIIGGSNSFIESIPGESTRQLIFTWPEKFEKEPVSSKVYLRTKD